MLFMKNDIYYVLERLANVLRQEVRHIGAEQGLLPVQQEALYYLSVCNRYSDTAAAVTDYLGLTKGTVSQTLKVLEGKGLIVKEKDTHDKRVTHLVLTQQGKTYLEKTSPPANFLGALDELQQTDIAQLHGNLHALLKAYQNKRNRTLFGVCKSCKYNLSEVDGFRCGLTQQSLSSHDVSLICREYLEKPLSAK